MTNQPPQDPLHGVTLKALLTDLVDRHGFEELAYRIPIDCFLYEPSFVSSLKFLRKNEWARRQVEDLYLADRAADARQAHSEGAKARPSSNGTESAEVGSNEDLAD